MAAAALQTGHVAGLLTSPMREAFSICAFEISSDRLCRFSICEKALATCTHQRSNSGLKLWPPRNKAVPEGLAGSLVSW